MAQSLLLVDMDPRLTYLLVSVPSILTVRYYNSDKPQLFWGITFFGTLPGNLHAAHRSRARKGPSPAISRMKGCPLLPDGINPCTCVENHLRCIGGSRLPCSALECFKGLKGGVKNTEGPLYITQPKTMHYDTAVKTVKPSKLPYIWELWAHVDATTPPKTHMLHLKIDSWNWNPSFLGCIFFVFGGIIFIFMYFFWSHYKFPNSTTGKKGI